MENQIKNIIFDFGGVIINIDPLSVVSELQNMGYKNILKLHEKLLADNAYVKLELGTLSPAEFRQIIKDFLGGNLSDQQIDFAWNSIIKDIPPGRIELLEKVRKNYKSFLLSNSNEIHYEYYNDYVKKNFSYENLSSLFDKAYYSFKMRLYKPDPVIFQKILKENDLKASETIFIDDTRVNVDAANELGIKGYHLDDGIDVRDLFDTNGFWIAPTE